MKKIVIISGLSGAGKTTALGFFEDLGYFCMDNTPSVMLENLMGLIMNSQVTRVAMVVDVRSEIFGDPCRDVSKMKESYSELVKIIFVEASDEEIVRRYALTRRRHPLSIEMDMDLRSAIAKEREALICIREIADLIIDTSEMNHKKLREKLSEYLKEITEEKVVFTFRIQSFGYKYGLPIDSDFVFDTRFFPNPFYIPELSEKTGLDREVKEYFSKYPEMEEYSRRIVEMLLMAKQGYLKEGRMGLSVAIGCSGGKHRSVYIADRVGNILRDRGEKVVVEHRDVRR